MNKFTRITFKLLDLLIIFVMTFGSPMSALAYVWTDPTDYPPGSTVMIRGDNSDEDNDHNFLPNENVHVDVVGPNGGYTLACDAVADENGTWACDVTLSADPAVAVGEYIFTATGLESGNVETGIFTDANPSATLDQCANDPAPSPSSDGCSASASDWINGNMGASKSVYYEGDSLPYRLTFDNLSLASHNVTIEWDTTKSDKHALDYLTTFNRTVTTANPCLGVSGCGAATTFPIPADPQVTGAGVTPVAGNFTMYGGTITAVSAYSYADGAGFTGDKSARITITFTASQANPVLAWAGHISSRADWGANNSAVAIPGSPYHTRLIDLDGSGGNQDRSLSADAVIFPGSLTIIKDAIPNDAQDFAYTTTGGLSLNSFSLDDDGDGTLSNTQVFSNITNFTTYTVTETAVAGWTLSFNSPVCTVTSVNGGSQSGNTGTRTVTINLQEGENVTCTFINTRQAATLTLSKTVNNDNGGTAVANDFQAYIDGGAVPWNSAQSVSPGSHTASESNLPGYTASSWGGDCAADGSVSISAGQNKTCTITNSDDPPSLTLVKVVTNNNGGTAVAADWTLTATGPTGFSGAGPSVSNGDSFDAGTYDLTESGPAGYTASDWVCVGGTQNDADTITVGLGESATCTITNDDNNTSLTLIKHVINDNGGTAVASGWTLYAGANSVAGSESGAVVTTQAGTYALSESSVAGYSNTSVSCDNGDGPLSVTVDLGENVTCTFVNDDLAPSLTLVKVVVNDNGGTAVESDWTLTASGPTGFSGTGPSVSNGDSFDAGTYDLSESGPAGYSASDWVCDGGTQNDADTVTVGLGQDVTCTITNDDNAASLTLIKHVTNDNGGTAVASAWTLYAGANSVTGSETGAQATDQAGTYNLSESSVDGYTNTSITCDNSVGEVTSVTVGLGESVTCTFVNDDDAASLILVKHVVNDNGGTAVAGAWTLYADALSVAGSEGGAQVTDQAGTYDLSESSVPGYSNTSVSCDNGDGPDSVTVGLGETVTCTFVNDDNAPALTLVKVVVNDNGGTAVESDWTLTAAGPTGFSGAGPSVSNDPSFDAGTYDLSESGPAGYSASDWVCDGGTQDDSDTITLGLGESATCTITNNDIAPKLHLRKIVVNNNGGTAVDTDWTLTADGAGTNDLSGPTPVDSGAGLQADTFALSESGPSGYSASSWVCVGGTQNGSDITVGIGGEATCTITNNDIPPQLHLRKIVVNNNGGTALATAWTLNADGSGSNDLSGSTPVDSGAGLQADTFALSETGPAGYSASDWVCDGGTQNGSNITVGIGQSATCTITNDDIAPKLHLRKIVINDNGGTRTEADFTLTANGTGSNDLSGTSPVDSGAGLQADTWALSETSVYGYSASAWVCEGGTQNGSNITVGIGGEATCTITNDDQPGTIIVEKIIKPVGALTSFSFQTTGDDGANALPDYQNFSLSGGSQDSQTLDAGSYTVQELVPLGWTLTGIGGGLPVSADPANTQYYCTVTGSGGSSGIGDLSNQTAAIDLKNGDTVKCVFENTGQGATRTQGFWATHLALAKIAWEGGSGYGHTFPGVANVAGIGDTLICGRDIDALGMTAGSNQLMGGFWSDIPKKSTGAKRSSIDQARMQLLQQLLAAELNASAFGSVPSGGSGMFAQWEAALCGNNQNAITTAKQQAASFNTNGDSTAFTPGTSADSRTGRFVADIVFWDIIKP